MDTGRLTLQVFVANPNKPPEIARILKRNKERLLVFLKDFHNDKEGECRVGDARVMTMGDDIVCGNVEGGHGLRRTCKPRV